MGSKRTFIVRPTSPLLHDAIRKTLECSAEVSEKRGLKGGRQSRYHRRPFKKSSRKIPPLKRSPSQDEAVREARKAESRDAHQGDLAEAAVSRQRAEQTRIEGLATPSVSLSDLARLRSLDGACRTSDRPDSPSGAGRRSDSTPRESPFDFRTLHGRDQPRKGRGARRTGTSGVHSRGPTRFYSSPPNPGQTDGRPRRGPHGRAKPSDLSLAAGRELRPGLSPSVESTGSRRATGLGRPPPTMA